MKSFIVGVVLPQDAKPGDTICGRVVSDPKTYESTPGLRVVEIAVSLLALPDGSPSLEQAMIDLGDSRNQRADRPFFTRVPPNASTLPIAVRSTAAPGSPSEASVSVNSGTPPSGASSPPSGYETPPVCAGNVQVIRGPFQQGGSAARIDVGGREARVVAGTSRMVFWTLPEGAPPGEALLTLRDAGRTVTFHVCVLALQMAADQLTLMRGQSTAFHVTLLGLGALPAAAWRAAIAPELVDLAALGRSAPRFRPPAPGAAGVVLLTIENTSKETISLDGSNQEIITCVIGPGNLRAGVFSYDGKIRSRQSGGFSVRGTVIPFLSPVRGEPLSLNP